MDEKQKLTEKIKSLLTNKEEVIFAYIYGSFLESSVYRDIDIGVYVDPKTVKEEEAFEYSLGLSTELSYQTGLSVDVTPINYSPLGLKINILRGKLLFSKDEKLRELIVETASLEYMEYYHLSREFLNEVLNG